MADEKKSDAKPAPAVPGDPFVEVVWLVLSIFAILYIINGFVSLFVSSKSLLPYFDGGISFRSILNFLNTIFPYLKYVMVILSVVLIYWIVFLYKKLTSLRKGESKLFYVESAVSNEMVNPQWEKILTHVESVNENDWKLGIIECDIMLDGILNNLSLPGDSIGDKLKAVEKSDFLTVDNAWEAHKIRNQIAHEGGSFVLNQREAKRVVELYRTVFEEFQII